MVEFVSDLDKAWDTITQWGYSWKSEDYEKHFMVDTGKGYIWYEWMDDKTTAIHMACNPSFEGRFLSRHIIEGMVWAAELMGVRRIYNISDCAETINYVIRLGWSKDETGYYLDV